ncbi:LacI family DNA-binding transcriptional regulator [Ruania alba]|uniref:Transcriptional regulator, LacI family n=1 Tax=Ruania alba TaxID=648782 RepID=A0A1H5M808_9MICO|nr:LacI family DNA-binding transcriptional regulator [Ruania alba]SEE85402.1 transcriptional regulator, LacI family [Ruania alba]
MPAGTTNRPNSRDVARHAGVSVGTVSNVLNKPELVASETRAKVEAAIGDLGFVRNRSARQLRMGRSQTVGLLVGSIRGPYFSEVAAGVERRLTEAELSLTLSSCDRDAETERRLLVQLEEQGVRGILLAPSSDDFTAMNQLRSRGTPVVLLDLPSPYPDQCSVASDDVKGGAMAAAHLIEMGHRRIGLVTAGAAFHQAVERRAGLHQAVEAAGLDVKTTVREVTVVTPGAQAGEAAVPQLMAGSNPPTAVMCINDLLALGVLRGLRAQGLQVPDDVAVVGYDDLEFSSMLSPSLTSVRRPKAEFGSRAAALLLDEIEHGQSHLHEQVLFTPELVVRSSSDPARTP